MDPFSTFLTPFLTYFLIFIGESRAHIAARGSQGPANDLFFYFFDTFLHLFLDLYWRSRAHIVARGSYSNKKKYTPQSRRHARRRNDEAVVGPGHRDLHAGNVCIEVRDEREPLDLLATC